MTSTPVPDDAAGVAAARVCGLLGEAVAAAQEALRAAGEAARRLGELSAADHVAVLGELAVVQRLADAVGFAVVDSLAGLERGDLGEVGATSVTDAVARAAGTSHATARRWVATASSARPDRSAGDLGEASAPALPSLGAVHAAGRVSTEVLELAVRSVRSLPARLRKEHQAALDALLADFDPAALEQKLGDEGRLTVLLAGGRRAKLWELFVERYAALADQARRRFLGDLDQAFREAYRAKLGQIGSGGRR
jgi:hypothetical protein